MSSNEHSDDRGEDTGEMKFEKTWHSEEMRGRLKSWKSEGRCLQSRTSFNVDQKRAPVFTVQCV